MFDWYFHNSLKVCCFITADCSFFCSSSSVHTSVVLNVPFCLIVVFPNLFLDRCMEKTVRPDCNLS